MISLNTHLRVIILFYNNYQYYGLLNYDDVTVSFIIVDYYIPLYLVSSVDLILVGVWLVK